MRNGLEPAVSPRDLFVVRQRHQDPAPARVLNRRTSACVSRDWCDIAMTTLSWEYDATVWGVCQASHFALTTFSSPSAGEGPARHEHETCLCTATTDVAVDAGVIDTVTGHHAERRRPGRRLAEVGVARGQPGGRGLRRPGPPGAGRRHRARLPPQPHRESPQTRASY